MVDFKAFAAWVGVSGFLIVAGNLICGNTLTASDPDFLDQISLFLGFAGCAGTAAWFTLLVTLIVGGGAAVIIGSFLVPILAGAASNAIVGTILAIATVTALIGVLTAVLI